MLTLTHIYVLSLSKAKVFKKVYVKHSLLRHFFTGLRTKEYHGRKLVGYSQEQMYNVVSDVENYKFFVPYCTKSTVKVKRPGYLKAELEVGFPPIIESYSSHVTLIKPYLVSAKCVDGSLFNFLETNWKFSPGLRSVEQSSIVDFSIIFEFKSIFHSQLALMFFDMLVNKMEWAFVTEAKRRFGKESLPSHEMAKPKS